MTTCILTGFAIPNRKIVASYLCDGSNIPATQDLGTRVFSGPFETAQSVPAPEVTYTIIGTTPCGGQVRQTSTKTYSSRSVANQWKFPITWTATGNFSPPGFTGSSIGYGTTLVNAQINARINAIAYGPLGALYIGGGAGSGVDVITSIQDGGTGLFGGIYTSYVIGYFSSGNAYLSTGQTPELSPSQITLYYLDIHEVLTYDLI